MESALWSTGGNVAAASFLRASAALTYNSTKRVLIQYRHAFCFARRGTLDEHLVGGQYQLSSSAALPRISAAEASSLRDPPSVHRQSCHTSTANRAIPPKGNVDPQLLGGTCYANCAPAATQVTVRELCVDWRTAGGAKWNGERSIESDFSGVALSVRFTHTPTAHSPFYYDPLPLNAHLAHVVTGHPDSAERARQVVGADSCGTDFRHVTENPDIDIVHICTPNHLHREALVSRSSTTSTSTVTSRWWPSGLRLTRCSPQYNARKLPLR